MSYIALARKWRPRTFSQLIGQDHVGQALRHSLNEQRLHHAYIFTGTRGVGKTSIARLFAKALNCEKGISAEPCLECDACVAIEQGRFLDLIEIDAASKTGVEDTRQLLDNAQYLPTNGRFKIYLIDEVHMLSQSSFNALLKTLEEPPAHVKFFLATTDPQKIPVTVLSRCLQFSLRAIREQDIASQLIHILKEESISFEQPAIDIIAHAAQGSMRDGLSLLDQALAMGNQQVTLAATEDMLGYTHQDYALNILQALADSNAKAALTLAAEIGQEGGHYSFVTEQLLHYLHQMMIYQQIGNPAGITNLSDALVALADFWSCEDLQLYYQILLHGQAELALAPLPAIGFDVMLIRLLQFEPMPRQSRPEKIPLADSAPNQTKVVEQQPTDTRSSVNQAPKPLQFSPDIQPDKVQPVQQQIEEPSIPEYALEEVLAEPVKPKPEDIQNNDESSLVRTEPETKTVPQINTSQDNPSEDWFATVNRLNVSGMAKTALDNTSLKSIDENAVYLVTHGGHLSLFIPPVRDRITEALSTYYGRQMKLHIEEVSEVDDTPAKIQAAQQVENKKKAIDAIEQDPIVQEIKENFSANVLENSITFRTDEL